MSYTTFAVVAVSANTNSFGLRGHLLVSRDAQVWEVGFNHLRTRKPGDTIQAYTTENGGPLWHTVGAEVPEKLTVPNAKALARKAFPKVQLKLEPNGDPYGRGFVASQSGDGGKSWIYRGDIGARPRSFWRSLARRNGFQLCGAHR